MAFAKGEIKTEYYNKKAEPSESRWWKVTDAELHESVFMEVNRIRKSQTMRDSRLSFLGQLYQNEDVAPFRSGYYIPQRLGQSSLPTLNVIKSNIDTLTSKIGTKKPKPVFLTKKGNWALQRRAKNLTKYIEGVFQTGGAWKEGRTAFTDACRTGTGCLQVLIRSKKIVFDRINEGELVVDEYESMYGKPPQLFRDYWLLKDDLIEQYPKLKTEINAAATQVIPQGGVISAYRMVRVIEAWRPATDFSSGKWCKVISTVKLESKEYTRNYYPFIFLPYTKKIFGFWGLSLSEDVLGIQLEINRILRHIAKCQHLMSVPQTWLEIQSKGIAAESSNKPGARRYYKGQAPLFFVPQAMSAEVYQHLESLIQKSYQATGVSQLSAQGKKPSGVDARVALRELQDIESERFQTSEQQYDEMYLEAVPIVIDLTDELSKDEPNLMVKVASKNEMKSIKWKDVRLAIDTYVYQIFPSSLLPSSPSGKLQFVQELMQTGIYDRETAVSLLDFPDTEAANSLITATRDSILRIIAGIEDGEGYDPPEPEINLDYARAVATNAYVADRNDKAPSDVLESILGLIADLDGLIEKRDRAMQQKQIALQQAQATPQNSLQTNPDAMAAEATAVPEQPPVSELMAIA